jgi:hypothetical protein
MRFTLRNKLKMALLLFVVFAGLLIRNFVVKYHISELGTSFNSVYKDRLVVEGYIYELSNCLHAKTLMLDKTYSAGQSPAVSERIRRQNKELSRLIAAYEQTRLTQQEAQVLVVLKQRLQTLGNLEQYYLNHLKYGYSVNEVKTELSAVITSASGNLQELSAIQLAVGKDMNDNSQKILSESAVFSQFGIVMLIVIGLIIQMLIFRSNEGNRTSVPDVHLN